MVFSLSSGKQFADIIIAKALSKSERACLGPISSGTGRLQDFIQAHAQGGVNDLLEGLVKLGGAFFRFARDIWVERQGSSHPVIMMSNDKMSICIPAGHRF